MIGTQPATIKTDMTKLNRTPTGWTYKNYRIIKREYDIPVRSVSWILVDKSGTWVAQEDSLADLRQTIEDLKL